MGYLVVLVEVVRGDVGGDVEGGRGEDDEVGGVDPGAGGVREGEGRVPGEGVAPPPGEEEDREGHDGACSEPSPSQQSS